jgi:uncharacterized protein YycO
MRTYHFAITERPSVPAHTPHVLAAYSRRTALPSFLTRALTAGANWSHCAAYDWERELFIEAQMFKGVIETPVDKWIKHYPSFEVIRVACPRPLEALQFWREQVGKGYDYLGAISVLGRANWQDDHRWYCSEHLEAGVAKGGNPRFFQDKHGVSPHESWNAL